MELTAKRLEQARLEDQKRRLADKQREVMDQLESESVKSEVKIEPMIDDDFPPLIPDRVKAEVKTDPDALPPKLVPPKMVNPQKDPVINVLNPIAGAQHIPKLGILISALF